MAVNKPTPRITDRERDALLALHGLRIECKSLLPSVTRVVRISSGALICTLSWSRELQYYVDFFETQEPCDADY